MRLQAKFKPTAPTPGIGSFKDLEEMTLESKLSFLRGHKKWKCMNKTEVLGEHTDSWKSNGLNSLRFEEISRQVLLPHCIKITVDVMLNDHWTDLVCGVDDTQLQEPVVILRRKFAESTKK